MAINRGPFNALVDDDGTNTTGSIWNKAAIKTVLLDPIDAALGGVWTAVAFAPANFAAQGGGTWTVEAADQGTFKWRIDGPTLFVILTLNATSISGTVSRLDITLPGGVSVGSSGQYACIYDNSVTVPGTGLGVTGLTAGKISLIKSDGSNFTASANQTYIRGSWFFEII